MHYIADAMQTTEEQPRIALRDMLVRRAPMMASRHVQQIQPAPPYYGRPISPTPLQPAGYPVHPLLMQNYNRTAMQLPSAQSNKPSPPGNPTSA